MLHTLNRDSGVPAARVFSEAARAHPSTPTLRLYQADCLAALAEAVAAGRSSLGVMPTGSGKSLVIAALMAGLAHAGRRSLLLDTRIVGAFDLWLAKDHRQRVLWPSTVVLSHEYFESLRRHAIPLSEEACGALAHSALALDAYAWLAQRLCRIRPGRKQFITWAALKDQFGFGYNRMIDFKRSFRQTLVEVHSQYRGAKFDIDGQGMTLLYSLPPIPGRCLDIIKDD